MPDAGLGRGVRGGDLDVRLAMRLLHMRACRRGSLLHRCLVAYFNQVVAPITALVGSRTKYRKGVADNRLKQARINSSRLSYPYFFIRSSISFCVSGLKFMSMSVSNQPF